MGNNTMDTRPLIEQAYSDVEQQPVPPAPAVDLIAHLQSTQNLNSESLSLSTSVLRIQANIQLLLERDAITQEQSNGLKQALCDWLTNVDPKIEKYNGKGLSELNRAESTNIFLEHIDSITPSLDNLTITSNNLAILESLTFRFILLLIIELVGFLPIIDGINRLYSQASDDDHKTDDNTPIIPGYLPQAVSISEIVIGASIMLSAVFCFFAYPYTCQHQNPVSTARIKVHLKNHIRQMIENNSLMRHGLHSLREDTNPSYFYELALKIHAKLTAIDPESQIDINARNIFNILGQFSNASTAEGNEFRQFLFDQDHAYMLDCIHRLLAVEVDTADDNQALTLEQSLESTGHSVEIILDGVDTLRQTLGYTPWTWATQAKVALKDDASIPCTQVRAALFPLNMVQSDLPTAVAQAISLSDVISDDRAPST